MKFFLDTASLKDISWAAQAGLIDGITTNPSLLAKQAGDLDPRDVLKEICSLVEYQHMTLQAAADEVIQRRLTALGGDGGVIAITPDGQMAWSFNSAGMYRARASDGQAVQVGIYKDER
jgi:transaldolase